MGTLQSLFFRPQRGYRKYEDSTLAGTKVSDTLYQLDGVVTEQHTAKARLTKNPVEFGVDITDHIIIQPKIVVVNGVVTNSPFAKQLLNTLPGDATFVSTLTDVLKGSRARNAYQGLLDLQNERTKIRLQTGFKVYDNMVLTEISAPDDVQNNLKVKMTFEEVFILNGTTSGIITSVTSFPTDADYITVGTTLASLGIAGATLIGF